LLIGQISYKQKAEIYTTKKHVHSEKTKQTQMIHVTTQIMCKFSGRLKFKINFSFRTDKRLKVDRHQLEAARVEEVTL